MKICEAHWAMIKCTLYERGLHELFMYEPMVKRDPPLPGERVAFNPLRSCNDMVWGRAIHKYGNYVLSLNEDGSHKCPICVAIKAGEEGMTATEIQNFWIEKPATQALEMARRQNLAPPLQ